MQPAGYMAKFVEQRPDWLACAGVVDVFSVSSCISGDFCDYTNFWMHNGYWFFDTPEVVREVAGLAGVDLARSTLFYYEAYALEFDQDAGKWLPFDPEENFPVAVEAPEHASLAGFDVASFQVRSSPECSPLSCNGLATSVPVNRHCLFESFSEAVAAIETGQFRHGEPGALRVFSVHTVPWSVA